MHFKCHKDVLCLRDILNQKSLSNIPDIRKRKLAFGSKRQLLEYFTLEFIIKAIGSTCDIIWFWLCLGTVSAPQTSFIDMGSLLYSVLFQVYIIVLHVIVLNQCLCYIVYP